MKHKTENTHKTHYKAAVRLQWRDSMAQHGRLVISCTGTLYILPTKKPPYHLFMSGPSTWSVLICGYHQHEDRAHNYCGISVHVFIEYSHSDLSDKIVKLHLDLHMHLAQG